jgi:hypothetical protein
MSLNAHAALTKPEIHASYASLGLGAVGFMMFGLGNILAAEGALTYPGRMSWVLQFAGPICIAIALAMHLGHLGYRIGKPSVVLFISGTSLLGLCTAHLVISPELWNNKTWSNIAQGLWALGLFCLSAGFAAIAVHKERQIEHGIAQVRDLGDTDMANVSVHASFLSLITGSVGFLLYAVGYVQLLEVAGGTRWSWILQSIGCALLALAVIYHLERLVHHLGIPAVLCGALSAIILAISSLPFAIDTENYISSPDWAQFFWNVWGAGTTLAAISILFIIHRKWSLARK